jgi:hypothetical protein
MKQQGKMQKGKNASYSLIVLLFIIHITPCSSQTKIEGEYYNKPYMDFYNTTVFYKTGIFEDKNYQEGHLISYSKGHYFIKNDSLVLNYDLTELKTNDYHTYKYYVNDKDSIKVRMIIQDMNNKPLPNTWVTIFSNKTEKKSDKNGRIEFFLKKEKKEIEFYVTNSGLGYSFSIWKHKNHEIDIFLNKYDIPTPYKNQINKYKILKLSKEEIKLKTKNSFLLLKKVKDSI